jgi:hypothetical protein
MSKDAPTAKGVDLDFSKRTGIGMEAADAPV